MDMRGLEYDATRWSVVAGTLFLSTAKRGPGDADAGTELSPVVSTTVASPRTATAPACSGRGSRSRIRMR
ncbi:MAG: hypothetical protein ACRDPO_35010 [Streptosporangiaceae bacterium]